MIGDVLKATEGKMRKTVETLAKDLAAIRAGRAHPELVENLKVDYFGVPTPLQQLASISVPEARLLVIQPWERRILPTIEKAIQRSDLGLNPSSDGNVLRLAIPPLTEDRRKDLVKTVRKRVEEGRIALRNVRREALEELRQSQKEKNISLDEEKKGIEHLQKLTDGFIAETDEVGKKKETELLEI